MVVKIYYPRSKKLSRAMARVRECLLYSIPEEIELIGNPVHADIQVIDFIGQHPRDPSYLDIFDIPPYPIKRKYIVINHCPPPDHLLHQDYTWLFYNALAIISYIPPEDRFQKYGNIEWDKIKDRYITTPWGVDHRKFIRMNLERDIDIVFTGYVAQTEAHYEIYEACKRLKKRCVHIGGSIGLNGEQYYTRLENLSDIELVYILNRSKYVSAMRHVIGFEIIGLEGAFTGARPIYLDYPIYRYWFNDIGLFVRPDNIVDDLVAILNREPLPIPIEKLERFKCENISRNVWNKLMELIKY